MDDSALRQALAQLCSRYRRLEAAVAWCGSPKEEIPYSLLEPVAPKATMLVGTDFDHSHPDGLAMLRGLGLSVRVVEMEDGVFHPKLYLFTRPGYAALLIGSTNFTASAFMTNYEASVLIEGTTSEMAPTLRRVQSALRSWRQRSRALTDEWLVEYRKRYKKARRIFRGKRTRLSPVVRDETVITPLTFIQKAGWREYYRRVSERLRGVDVSPMGSDWERVIDAAKVLLPRRWTAVMLEDIEVRRLLGGLAEYGNFGHVAASGGVRHLLANGSIEDKSELVSAMNAIRSMEPPLHPRRLVTQLRRLVSLGPTMKVWGRFLLLARPDLYFSVSHQNLRRNLGGRLGIPPGQLATPQGYARAVRLLHATAWFTSPRPANADERRVWDARVAYVDALYRD